MTEFDLCLYYLLILMADVVSFFFLTEAAAGLSVVLVSPFFDSKIIQKKKTKS